jgi:formylglycine-generating enzyme required for sulfatase activity
MTNYYQLRDARKNPEGPTEEEAEVVDCWGKKSKARVLRGGSWFNYSLYCPSVKRHRVYPSSRNPYYGFRVVVSVVR